MHVHVHKHINPSLLTNPPQKHSYDQNGVSLLFSRIRLLEKCMQTKVAKKTKEKGKGKERCLRAVQCSHAVVQRKT